MVIVLLVLDAISNAKTKNATAQIPSADNSYEGKSLIR